MPRPSSRLGELQNRTKIARHFGVAETTIDNWALAGMPVVQDGKRKLYNTKDIADWREKRARSSAGGAFYSEEDEDEGDLGPDATGTQKVSFTEARRRKEVALADLRELEVKEKRGKLIDGDALANSLAKLGQVIRESVQRVALQLAPEIHAARDEWEAREIAQRGVDQILTDAANGLRALIPSDSGDVGRDPSDTSDETIGMGGSAPSPIQ